MVNVEQRAQALYWHYQGTQLLASLSTMHSAWTETIWLVIDGGIYEQARFTSVSDNVELGFTKGLTKSIAVRGQPCLFLYLMVPHIELDDGSRA